MSYEITPDAGRPYQRTPFAQDPPPSREPRKGANTVRCRIDPQTLDRVDQALIAGDPPAISDVYRKFNLAQRGVSIHMFYRYASRIRLAGDLRQADPDATLRASAIASRLPDLVAELLLDLCASPAPASRTVHRLALAYRAVTITLLARKRADLDRRIAAASATEGASRREIEAIVEAARELRCVANDALARGAASPAGALSTLVTSDASSQ